MKQLLPVTLVTSNHQKAYEIGQALRPYGISVKPRAIELDEIQALDIATVVTHKVEQAYALVQRPVLVDDTGIFFVGYNHFPGIFSRYAFMSLGFAGLFKLITPGQRAYFCSYLALKTSAKAKPVLFKGVCRGRLLRTVRGPSKPKMPYDNIFIPDGDTQTFAQLGVTGKQRYDHRSKAVRKFARYYLNQL
ncbi:MAG: hypothetical protein HY565_03850 [Candidatus Kerfeldbacteria bacterium]|nr:hypothetical protein [Candidatus Kerfeldbacteria bacterium]